MPASGARITPREFATAYATTIHGIEHYGNRKRTPDNLHIRVTEAPSPPTTSWEGKTALLGRQVAHMCRYGRGLRDATTTFWLTAGSGTRSNTRSE